MGVEGVKTWHDVLHWLGKSESFGDEEVMGMERGWKPGLQISAILFQLFILVRKFCQGLFQLSQRSEVLLHFLTDEVPEASAKIWLLGLSENVVYPNQPTKWLFHWGYTPFSDIPIFDYCEPPDDERSLSCPILRVLCLLIRKVHYFIPLEKQRAPLVDALCSLYPANVFFPSWFWKVWE
jgi:hypothetical protein